MLLHGSGEERLSTSLREYGSSFVRYYFFYIKKLQVNFVIVSISARCAVDARVRDDERRCCDRLDDFCQR